MVLGKAIRIAAVLIGAAWLGAAAGPGTLVSVPGGVIEGIETGDRDSVFRGIPYAAPPLGDLRWRAPRPVAPWSGVRPATARARACPQNDYGWNRADHLSSSEDCLTLDIRTAALAGKRPVMVWIHGGSNRAGSAGDTALSTITRHGVVLVAIQYRLGILGFLAPRAAAREAGGHAGNYGLMDQLAALRWIQANIARFGGDPQNVTIFGESAGAQDVSLMLAAPAAETLFAKAIMESGTPGFGMPFRSLQDALAIGDQAQSLIAPGGSLATLRRAPVAALLTADRKLHDASLPTDDFLWLKTTIDGAVLPRSPRALLLAAPPRPVIIGSNRAEFGPSAGSIDIEREIGRVFGDDAAAASRFYRFGDPGRVADPRLGHPELELSTDVAFRCPAGELAALLAGRGWPVWRYEFDIAKDGGPTSHAAEMPYVLGDSMLGDRVSLGRYWTNFAIHRDPNGGGQPSWPRFRDEDRRYVSFDDRGVTAAMNLRAQPCGMLPNL